MALIGVGTEYVLHSLIWLVDNPEPVSALDLSELQDIPATFVAKLLPKLEKAGLLEAYEGLRGGYRLGRAAETITVLDVVEAVEGKKALFNCQEIRGRCVLFQELPPRWSSDGVCSIHAVMLRAERAMRHELAQTSLADLSRSVKLKAPPAFFGEVREWFGHRAETRKTTKIRQIKRAEKSKPAT